MKQSFFKILAKLNKLLFPSFSKRRLDPSEFNKLQLAILGWRAYITIRSLDN